MYRGGILKHKPRDFQKFEVYFLWRIFTLCLQRYIIDYNLFPINLMMEFILVHVHVHKDTHSCIFTHTCTSTGVYTRMNVWKLKKCEILTASWIGSSIIISRIRTGLVPHMGGKKMTGSGSTTGTGRIKILSISRPIDTFLSSSLYCKIQNINILHVHTYLSLAIPSSIYTCTCTEGCSFQVVLFQKVKGGKRLLWYMY